jgi:crotonobetainyl-CoA:carnitine CoA-transferase CaiB-like acyl-CoA transferase
MCVEVDHPLSNEPVRVVANPVKMSGTPIVSYTAPPTLGQHTDDVLHDLLHMSRAEIDALRARKII